VADTGYAARRNSLFAPAQRRTQTGLNGDWLVCEHLEMQLEKYAVKGSRFTSMEKSKVFDLGEQYMHCSFITKNVAKLVY